MPCWVPWRRPEPLFAQNPLEYDDNYVDDTNTPEIPVTAKQSEDIKMKNEQKRKREVLTFAEWVEPVSEKKICAEAAHFDEVDFDGW
jgi:hypothetical protein